MPDPPGFVVKNGHEQVAVFGRPGPSSSTQTSSAGPACASRRDAAAGLDGGVDGVAAHVDQELLELIGVGRRRRRRGRSHDRPARASRARRRGA